MSQQKDLLREMTAAHNSGASDRIGDWFTEDFHLHEPGMPGLPTGHAGASQMRERFKTLAADKPANPRYDRGRRSGCRALAADRGLRG